MQPYFTKDAVLVALRNSIPEAEWLLRQIESQEGWFRFPSFLSDAISNLKIENYPLLYSSEGAIAAMMLQGFLSREEVRALSREIESATIDERSQFIVELFDSLGPAVESLEIPKTREEREAAVREFEKLSPDDQQESIKLGQHFYSSFFATFYQSPSVMVHGEKLTSLVVQAQSGDDQAFVRAVQIDRRILVTIPYFRDRYSKAQDEADTDFFDLLSYRQRSAPYRGKIRHKTLWLAFSILEQTGLLDSLSHREILEMCDAAGVGGYENRIQSVKHLSSRIHEYREFQKRGFVTTP